MLRMYLLQDVWLTAPGGESAPAGDSGHLAVIVGGGGGQTDGGHAVTEGHGAGQLDDGEVIVIDAGTVAGMVDPLTDTKHIYIGKIKLVRRLVWVLFRVLFMLPKDLSCISSSFYLGDILCSPSLLDTSCSPTTTYKKKFKDHSVISVVFTV